MGDFSYDSGLIDRYLDESQILEHGIDYYLYEDPERSREEAAALAHAYTQRYCKRWCSRDRKDPQTRHKRAFESFVQKVDEYQYFCSPRRKKAAEEAQRAQNEADAAEARQKQREEDAKKQEKLRLRQLENERRRVAALREKCVAKGLDFHNENIRQLRKHRACERFFSVLMILFGIPCALSFLLIILWAILFGNAPGNAAPFDGFIAVVAIIWLVTGGLAALIMLFERKNLPKEAYAPLEEYQKDNKNTHK